MYILYEKLGALDLLDRQLYLFDGDVIAFTVKGEALPLRRPCLEEVVSYDLRAVVSTEDYGAGLTLDYAIDYLLAPLPQSWVIYEPSLKCDVAVLGTTRSFTKDHVVSVLELDDSGLRVKAFHVTECAHGDALDLDFEVIRSNMIK